MADGIRIQDAALEVSPQDVEALVRGQAAAVTVTKLDLTLSAEALNAILAGLAPEGGEAPRAVLEEGCLRLAAHSEGKPVSVTLRAPGFRLELGADGLRLVSE